MSVVHPGTSEKEVAGNIKTSDLGMFETGSVRASESLSAGICGG